MSEITVYEKFEADLVVFEAADAELKFDVSTSEGEEECRVYHRKLRKAYNAVDKVRKQTGADALQLQRDINSEAKKIFERIDAMAEPRKALLDAKEAEEQAKIDAIFEAKRIEDEKIEQERVDAIAAKEAELAAKEKALQDKADELKAAEDKLAEDKRVADAAEQARIDEKAKAAQDAKDAAELAERNQKAAVAKTEKEAKDVADKLEADRVKAEEERLNLEKLKAEKQERIDAKEADRVANEEHRENVEADIEQHLFMYMDAYGTFSKEEAHSIMTIIRDNKIPNLEIQY